MVFYMTLTMPEILKLGWLIVLKLPAVTLKFIEVRNNASSKLKEKPSKTFNEKCVFSSGTFL